MPSHPESHDHLSTCTPHSLPPPSPYATYRPSFLPRFTPLAARTSPTMRHLNPLRKLPSSPAPPPAARTPPSLRHLEPLRNQVSGFTTFGMAVLGATADVGTPAGAALRPPLTTREAPSGVGKFHLDLTSRVNTTRFVPTVVNHPAQHVISPAQNLSLFQKTT
jgi:hypothetical protein